MNNLRKYRLEAKMSQEALAFEVQMSPTTITHAENPKFPEPSDITKQKLADYFEVAVQELFPEQEDGEESDGNQS